MKSIAELLGFVLVLFLLGVTGCSKTLAPLSFCAVGSEKACADLRDGYSAIRGKAE